MQRLYVCLQGLGRKQWRAVAAAFEKGHSRHHRISCECVEREHQRPLHQTMDHEPMLAWIAVRNATIDDYEMQTVRGNRAVDEMVWRACARSAWLAARIANRAHDVFLELRRSLVGLDNRAGFEAPRRLGQGRVRQGLSCGASQRPEGGGAHGAGKNDPAPEQRTTVHQAIASNGLYGRGFGPTETTNRAAHVLLLPFRVFPRH